MNKIVMLFILTVGIVLAFLYKNKAHDCEGSFDGVTLPNVFRVSASLPIVIRFDMRRTPKAGCPEKRASEFYKNVSCGYRLIPEENWSKGQVISKIDNELKYSVDCQIPSVKPETTPGPSTLEYYFEYSAWGKPPERQVRTLIIE